MRRFVLLLLVATIVAGCSDPSAAPPTTTTPGAAEFPVVVTTDEGPVTVERAPARIVSMSSTATEMLYAIGAGPRIVATDLFSDYPAAAAATEKLDAFNFSAEEVAATDPDLVFLAFDTQGESDALAALGIQTIVLGPADRLEGVYSQLVEVGTAIGLRPAAEDLATSLRGRIEAALTTGAESGTGLSVYHEIDPTFFSANSSTFIGDIYARLGLDNIADRVTDDIGGGFPQLSAELILSADPDVIFTTDGQGLADLESRPGWSTLTAVGNGRVFVLDEAVASRWGPRTVELVETVVAAIQKVAGG